MAYETILTNVGLQKIASATPEHQLKINRIAVGDGNGGYSPLDPDMTELVNEVWRGPASAPIRDRNDATIIVFEGQIPANVGGFFIREVGIFDDTGDLIAIGHTAATEKPQDTSGTALTLTVRFRVKLSNASETELIYNDEAPIDHQGTTNRDAPDAHPISSITGLDNALNGKADKSTFVFAGTGLKGGGALSSNVTLSVDFGTGAGKVTEGNDERLSNAREWTAETVSQAEAEAGTSTTRRAWTAQRVRQAVEAAVPSVTGLPSPIVPDTFLRAKSDGTGYEAITLEELSDALGAGSQVPLFFVTWCPDRDHIWPGYVAADGQQLSSATYPDAAAGIAAGTVPTTDDATWLADPAQRGKYVADDGSGFFRLPDYNGKQAGSLGAVFLRGDGERSAGVSGEIQEDALQNITGSFRTTDGPYDGAFALEQIVGSFATGSEVRHRVSFDASRVARTADETRPLNVTGCWVIKLYGEVVNVGSADAEQLASDYANLAGRLAALESRPSLGWGQTWQDVTTSRVAGTTYTNTTGRAIMVYIAFDPIGTSSTITLDAVQMPISVDSTREYASFIVPPGSTYRLSAAGSQTPLTWLELR